MRERGEEGGITSAMRWDEEGRGREGDAMRKRSGGGEAGGVDRTKKKGGGRGRWGR